MSAEAAGTSSRLRRVIGIPGAVLLGLGSMLGTGIFVSVGIAAEVAGEAVVVAVALAAIIATFSGLSSAQLAVNHPVSGGTYEYGYRWLGPWFGFSAGWMFLCAKTASAATAALGVAGYLLRVLGRSDPSMRTVLGLAAVLALTVVVAGGVQRSNRTNAVIVSVTLLGLLAFAGAGAVALLAAKAVEPRLGGEFAHELMTGDAKGILHATALMFVAYTGYGRIATLGEEVREPRRSIPRAIVVTLAVSAVLYTSVTLVAVATLGADGLARATLDTAAPLEVASRRVGAGWLPPLIEVGAITAMTGVVLNLLLGVSRVVLAMARRGDLPTRLAAIGARTGSPVAAVVFTGVVIAALVSIGSVRTTWTFSAFTVLVYYGLTNLAALRLSASERHVPRIVPALGLVSCLAVAAFVEPVVWLGGVGLLGVGLLGRLLLRRRR